jgi:hypothetical protein
LNSAVCCFMYWFSIFIMFSKFTAFPWRYLPRGFSELTDRQKPMSSGVLRSPQKNFIFRVDAYFSPPLCALCAVFIFRFPLCSGRTLALVLKYFWER